MEEMRCCEQRVLNLKSKCAHQRASSYGPGRRLNAFGAGEGDERWTCPVSCCCVAFQLWILGLAEACGNNSEQCTYRGMIPNCACDRVELLALSSRSGNPNGW